MLGSLRLYSALQGRYLRPYWPLVLLLGVLLFGMTGLQLVAPQIVRHFIDRAVEQEALRSLYAAVGLFLAAGLSVRVLQAVTGYLGRDIAWRATNRLRADLTLHVLRLDMGFHNARTPGDLLERIDGDIERLTNFFSQFFIQLVGAILLLAGLIVVTWLEDWRFGLSVAVFTAFFLLSRMRLLAFIVPLWQVESQARAELYGFLGERLSGLRDIRKAGAVSFTMARFYEVLRSRLFSWLKAAAISRLAWGFVSAFNSTRFSIGLAVGAYLFMRGEITIGTVYLIYQYLELLWVPINSISREFEDLQMAGASIRRVKELLDTKATVEDGHGADLPAGPLGVEFNSVSFAYRPGVTVLDDVSFRLEPGRSLGLLGRTGSGKTTMSRLLFRFYDPDQGEVKLGGADLRRMPLKSLRGRVGLVTQEVQLFQASVRDNLTFFDRGVPDRRIEATLDELGLGPWYGALPSGLDTELAAGGGQLSAGEAQLLAFTRVFLKDPDCVVLDEASSRLDPATERLIERAMRHLLRGRTAVIIAHRLSTVQQLDRIMIIQDGRVQEQGPREALAADPSSRFAGLLRTGLEEALS